MKNHNFLDDCHFELNTILINQQQKTTKNNNNKSNVWNIKNYSIY